MSPWEKHCSHLPLPFASKKVCFVNKFRTDQSKTQTALLHRLQWQLPGNWTLHSLMWSSSFCMDWNCFKYIIRSSALSAPMVSLITSCRGQNSPVPWDLWFLIPSFSLTQIVLLMQNSRFPNSFYPFFRSASCTEPVMNYIAALSRPTQTNSYVWNEPNWLVFWLLSQTSYVIHPTRVGAGAVKINILIQLKRAISLCYTSVASLESIS